MSESERREGEGEVLAVHFGRSASCSSIGSFVDFLFVSSVVGTAVIGAVAALMREQPPVEKAPRVGASEGEREDGEPGHERS